MVADHMVCKIEYFMTLNPIGDMPVMVDGDVVSDSFCYFNEKNPQHPLLPSDLKRKAINYQAAYLVSSSIQPLQSLPVLKYFEEKVGADEKVVRARTHVGKGFAALGKLLKDYAGKYATGDEVFPTQFPHLLRLHEAYSKLPAFQDAVPEKQLDAPSS
ncbi:glutathione S-transferase Z1 [Citrus sinensis]|uniref:Glutathione S-transferase Z1 n=1 Tax=Citrus sinensis TaxID=2711 RepID=A0ACB8K6S4_CITSI|nr:glutathione S-transferase Z1 [Citrus sinensis]